MNDLALARLLVAALTVALAALAALLLAPFGGRALRALPRADRLGGVLAALCWAWVATQLVRHPIDFLAFLTPTRTIVGAAVCLALTCVLLRNLICARAIGGLMMLWPMPVILAVRDQVTDWRLVPVLIGYVSLVIGMIVVFYPWVFRVACDRLAERALLRKGLAALCAVGAVGTCCTLFALGKVVGE